MKSLKLAAVALCAIMSINAADAITRITAGGTITGISALDGPNTIDAPKGAFDVGAKWSLTIDYDFSKYLQERDSALDPTINEYYITNTYVTIKIGEWSNSFSSLYYDRASYLVLGNNVPLEYDDGRTDYYDFQLASLYNTNLNTSDLPFDYGTGLPGIAIYFNLFDQTGLARTTDNISQYSDPSLFSEKTFFFAQNKLDLGASYFVGANGSVEYASMQQVAAVPELATWSMMIIGIGVTGGALRRRRRNMSMRLQAC